MQPLDHVIEQLWSPALDNGLARVVTNPTPDPDWLDVERYWAVPDLAHARILMPRGTPGVTAAAISNYRGLRFPLKNALRAGATSVVRLGVPPSRHRVAVQVRRDAPDARASLPLTMLARALGRDRVHASIGVRTGDNRKATVALLNDLGCPVGYAKFGWDSVTDELVSTEAAVLAELGGLDGLMRAPAALARLDYHGHPVVVTEPLPLDVRGAMNNVAPLTSQEMYSLMPVHRHAPVAETGHFAALTKRLEGLDDNPVSGTTARRARDLVAGIRQLTAPVPVTARWHGDLTPWNRARTPAGQLWVWDWESCEEDAVAGLDPMHWSFSVHRLSDGHLDPTALRQCLAEAGPHLTAAGVRRDARSTVAAVYALVVVERACTLAAHHESWDSVWISPTTLTGLVRQALDLLG